MKTLIFGLLLIATSSRGEVAAVSESDITNRDGSAKVLWKNMTEKQKAFVLERNRAHAEYIVANQGKRFSELKNVPRFMYPPKISAKDKIYFSTEAVIAAYQELGDLESAAKLAKADYESNPDGGHGPYKLRTLIGLLSSAGRHKEALEFYQKYLEELLPSYSKEDFATKKSIPNNPTYNEAMKFGDELKKRAADPKRPEEPEAAIRMHRAFHSKDRRKRLEALEFYSRHRIRFMLEKANDDPEIKQRARDYIKELEGK